jgi:hypothetical protein
LVQVFSSALCSQAPLKNHYAIKVPEKYGSTPCIKVLERLSRLTRPPTYQTMR